MLFLLPPSETKLSGGNSPSIAQLSLPFNQLAVAREELLRELEGLLKNDTTAIKALKLPKTQTNLLQVNREIRDAGTMPAINRYSGTLYDALNAKTLTATAIRRAGEQVLIQSALFGLISAQSMIPNYRFSATTKLPNLSLREIWPTAHHAVFERLQGSVPIIDLRSKSYVELAPINTGIENYWVEVVTRTDDGEIQALNHFNKKAKGELVRAALMADTQIQTLRQLRNLAAKLGFQLEAKGSQLTLIV